MGVTVAVNGRVDRAPAAAWWRVLVDPWVAGFLLLGLGARLVYAFTWSVSRFLGDQLVYREIGQEFAAWWASGDLTRTPGYPVFAGIGYAVSGDKDGAVVLGQCLLMTAACAALTLTAARLGGRGAAIACAALTALSIPLLTITGLILSETLAGAALAGSASALVLLRDRPLVAGLAAGGLASVAVLTRPNLLSAAVVLLVAGPSLVRAWPARRRLAAAFLAGACVLYAPWIIRNLDQAGTPSPLGASPASTYNTAAGVHLPSDHTSGRYGAYLRSLHFFSNSGPPGIATVATAHDIDPAAELSERIRTDPLSQASNSLFWLKELLLYPFEDHAQYGRPGPLPWAPQMVAHLAFLALALLGTVRLWRRRETLVLVGAAVAVCLPFAVIWSSPRYAIPALMLLAPMASVGLAWLIRAVLSIRPRSAVAAGA